MTARVSCLCVTRGPRISHAIAQFERQTYGERELVVVHQGLTERASIKLRAVNAVVVHAPQRLRLGSLRNLAVQAATGQWCIQWDDDDMFHQGRIERQLTHAINAGQEAQFMSSWFMRDVLTGDVFHSFRRLWEGSLLASRRMLLRHPYDGTLSKAEDSAQARAMVTHDKQRVGIIEAPELYLYQYHGANTWGGDHFRGLFERSKLLTPMQAAEVLRGFE